MARTAILHTDLRRNGAPSAVNTVNLDATNDHVINGATPESTVLVITNTDATPHTVTVKAGTCPPAIAGGQGDLTFTVPASGSSYFGPFESGRFMRNDGTVWLDIETGHTGTAAALRMPKGGPRA